MRQTPPAEWAEQQALFLGYPSHADLWQEDLEPARAEVAALATQLAHSVAVKLLVCGDDAARAATAAIGDKARIIDLPFGDIWLRDTGPIFLSADQAVHFRFNGWGGKYQLAGDTTIGAAMARHIGAHACAVDSILEGGAIEYNGAGLLLTTEQCLLNPNRNPGWTRAEAERILADALGIRRIVWLGDGLLNDHTDGHIDNLARFVDAQTVAVPESWTEDDPNTAVFEDAAQRIRTAGLDMVRIPSVGPFEQDGKLVPATHMNWIIANGQLVVPLYGTASDAPALQAIARAFPRHRVTGLPSSHILTGGGSFHCITQQVPA